MGKRVTLTEKRLTRKQVAELLASGAVFRTDLTEGFNGERSIKHWTLYELPGDRVLTVSEWPDSLKGKGDIWPLEAVVRLIRGAKVVAEDSAAGRFGSVSHWAFYSILKHDLPNHVTALLAELPTKLNLPAEQLKVSYKSLDEISARIEEIGVLSVRELAYDHLVAFVGEVMRERVNGRWAIERRQGEPHFPYVRSELGGYLMPINVVSGELSDMAPPNLRLEAANEVRRAQMEGRIRQSLGIDL